MLDAQYEHSDAVISLDVYPDGPKAAAEFKRKTATGDKVNPLNESLLLSADRDGNLILWSVMEGSD
jgi:hypothetical protein